MRGMFLGVLLAVIICAPGFWLLNQGHTVLGLTVILAPSVVGFISMWRDERKMKRQKTERAARHRDTVAAPLLAELDQTPEWWDAQYRALVKKQIPRDWASHLGHELDEPITFYASGYEMQRYCVDCGVTVDRPPDG